MSEPQDGGARVGRTRLLIINPNTNARVTENIRTAVRRAIAAWTSVLVTSPGEGPFAIETEDHRKAAEQPVLELVRDGLQVPYHGYVLAAFDDIGLTRARAVARVPVVGAVEAGVAAARACAPRFSVVTTVNAAVPGIRDQLRNYGAADMATVRAAGIGVADAADRSGLAQERVMQAIRLAVDEDGAEAVLLGSGGLTGWGDILQGAAGVPLIDGVLAAVKMAEALCALLDLRR